MVEKEGRKICIMAFSAYCERENKIFAALIFKPLHLDSCCSGRVMCEISHPNVQEEKDRRVRVMSHLYSIATQMSKLMSTVIEFRERTPDALFCPFRFLYCTSFMLNF